MKIETDYTLEKLNTFGINAKAALFAELQSEDEIRELFADEKFKQSKKLLIGGGSNTLFTADFNGIVVLNKLKGITVLENNAETIKIKVMGGEIWNDFVNFSVEHGYWGVENLALIPGTVGAAPMQNIAAYGAELKDSLDSLEAFEIETGEKKIFSKDECKLGYRESIFKNELKGKYFISAVVFILAKKGKTNADYGSLSEYMRKNNIIINGPKDISDAVSAIRRSKLPDPKILGNAGSFFKNVFVDKDTSRKLSDAFPETPLFEEEGSVKIPAGWLIEQCGPATGQSWKGYREGNVGVHEKHALILVNYGGASGKEVIELAKKIIASVKEKFGLELIPEVNII